jgi:serine kinase of HPr protein (carbohydrate metabolism regulator)
MSDQIHATCVELAGTGALLRGPSGSGKSDLALRLIDRGARLVADDRVVLEAGAGGVVASAPPALAGMLEVRGLGLTRVPSVARAHVGLVIDLVAAVDVERLPEPARCELLGTTIPCIRVDPFAASACAKVRLAAEALTHDILVQP